MKKKNLTKKKNLLDQKNTLFKAFSSFVEKPINKLLLVKNSPRAQHKTPE